MLSIYKEIILQSVKSTVIAILCFLLTEDFDFEYCMVRNYLPLSRYIFHTKNGCGT